MTFEKLSLKQARLLKWWIEPGIANKYDSIICDGAVRSGKTTVMVMSFILWAMDTFNNHSFGICGKTVHSAERNIIMPLHQIADIKSEYALKYTRSNSLLTVTDGERTNYFYIFGGRDESSYTLIQGITLAGVLFDEVALMPESFVNQAIARTLSISKRRLWFNCNPESPNHWFYTKWILQPEKKSAVHLHFTMRDNPILTDADIEKAERMYEGAFRRRYVEGLWVLAEGLIYRHFAEHTEEYLIDRENIPTRFEKKLIGIDWGDSGSGHAFVAIGITPGFKEVYVLEAEKHAAKDLTPADVERKVVAFVTKVIADYGEVQGIYCDHINTFINGCRTALRKEGFAGRF